MKRIEIFVSSRKDTRKERAVAERVIRSVAAEFALPISASYSNWLRAPCEEVKAAGPGANRSPREGALLLCPCFREYQDWSPGDNYREHIANTGHFDLVLCLLWCRLGTKMGPNFTMPDGTEPKSATHYEIAWALDQRKRTPEFSALQVYRNQSIPVAPFEPKRERERLFEQWDSAQACFKQWGEDPAFAGASSEYRNLGEFEEQFRSRFRDYIVACLRDELLQKRPHRRTYHWDTNPFRGLDFFDVEHARVFHGRTKTVGEALDVLQQQAVTKKPFLLVWGPGGCGKTSLVRAGLLPILTQVGTSEGDGPWRFACSRPGGGAREDPFDALAASLLNASALPDLPDAKVRHGWKNLAAELRERPESAALRLQQALNHLSTQALDPFLEAPASELPEIDLTGVLPLASQSRVGRFRPKAQLALVVDQLEELFVSGFAEELQKKYLAALSALVRCQRVFVIATLRSEFYPSFLRACSSDELAVLSGRFELCPPIASEIGEMIRLPAEAAGLSFEQELQTGQNLDEALLEMAMATAEPLPLLEHLLSELYRMQLTRKDGLLRWSDYRELGELESAVADHAEGALLALDGDAQASLKPVIRELVSPGHGIQCFSIRRPVPYRELVSAPQLDLREKAGAKQLIDRFIQEGLFHADTGPNKEMLVSITQEVLLRNWPRIRKLLKDELEHLQIRNRLEVNLKRWLSQGRKNGDLLRTTSSFSEAETLLREFRTSLSDIQVDYLQKSLKAQRGRSWRRNAARAAVIGGLAALVVILTFKSLNLDTRRKQAERALGLERRVANQTEARVHVAEKDAERAASQRELLQARLEDTEARAEQAQKNADFVAGQRDTLQAKLNQTEAKAQQAQKNAEQAASRLDILQAQLKDSEAKAQKAQQGMAELTTTQPGATEPQLRKLAEKAELAEKIADLVSAQLHPKPDEPSKKEPSKTGTDSANQVRSGRALPLDLGENPDPGSSIQLPTPALPGAESKP
jgi:hypothetical protein